MNRHQPSPRSHAGHAAIRRGWRELIAAAKDRAGAAALGLAYDKQAEMALAHGVFSHAKAPFPLGDAPAQGAARAFRLLAETFVLTTGTGRRAQLAPSLRALAEALEAMLEEAMLAEAAFGRRIIGEVDG